MEDGQKREYRELQLYCLGDRYYYSYDLIPDDIETAEIYMPLDRHMIGIRHLYIDAVQQIIESEQFLDSLVNIYVLYRGKVRGLVAGGV
jgi:hypothetical protein